MMGNLAEAAGRPPEASRPASARGAQPGQNSEVNWSDHGFGWSDREMTYSVGPPAPDSDPTSVMVEFRQFLGQGSLLNWSDIYNWSDQKYVVLPRHTI